MKGILGIVLAAMLLAVPTEKKTEWKSVNPMEFTTQPIDLLANRWMALNVGNQTRANSMTIAWGSFGYLWNKPIVIVYVSKDRFTKHLMDENDYFTVSGFPQSPECKAALRYLGSASGRNEDKMSGCGLTVKYTELGNPYFDEGNLTIECKKIYADAFNMDLLPAEEREGRYSRMGIHTFYIGEIVNIWEKPVGNSCGATDDLALALARENAECYYEAYFKGLKEGKLRDVSEFFSSELKRLWNSAFEGVSEIPENVPDWDLYLLAQDWDNPSFEIVSVSGDGQKAEVSVKVKNFDTEKINVLCMVREGDRYLIDNFITEWYNLKDLLAKQ